MFDRVFEILFNPVVYCVLLISGCFIWGGTFAGICATVFFGGILALAWNEETGRNE